MIIYLWVYMWVIPAMLLIMKYNNKLKFNKEKLFSQLQLSRSFLLVIIVSLIYIVISMFIIHNGFWFNSKIH